jgi:deleted-in-malignant-brain-tumors protein 1
MEGSVKLVDGPAPNEGRLMINYKNHYGAVCADRFGTSDANTACHQLGFAGQQNITGCCPYGRRPYGEIWLDELGCSSTDAWLANCTHRGWGVEDCHNGQEIGIRCNPSLNLRLSGGKHSFEGRVEQYFAGSWGTVCDAGWDMRDAKVVCRQLGLGAAVKALGGAFFGQGGGPTMLSNVDCIGHETTLGWCLHSGWKGRSCSHSRDANVICKGPVPQGFRAASIGTNSTSFTFNLPRQLQFTGVLQEYNITVKYNRIPKAFGRSHILTISPTDRKSVKPQFTVSGLTPCSNYTFEVAVLVSEKQGETGPFSAPLTVSTKPEVPGHVLAFTGVSANASCVKLSFKPPTPSYCKEIDSYQLTYFSEPGFGVHIAKSLTLPSPLPENTHNACGLKLHVLYKFMISAVNAAGSGPRATAIVYHYDKAYNV